MIALVDLLGFLQRRVVMNVSRFVSLVAAVVISALQWAPFFGTALQVQSMRVVSASAAGNEESSMPVVVVTARRQS